MGQPPFFPPFKTRFLHTKPIQWHHQAHGCSENGCEQTKIVDFVSVETTRLTTLTPSQFALASLLSSIQMLDGPSLINGEQTFHQISKTCPPLRFNLDRYELFGDNNSTEQYLSSQRLVFVDVLQPVQLAFSPDT
jgi:hypothetical protein